MNVATKVVGALVLLVILMSALFGVANDIIKDSGNKGVDAGNNRTNIVGCVARNSQRDNPRQWCQQNTEFKQMGVEILHA